MNAFEYISVILGIILPLALTVSAQDSPGKQNQTGKDAKIQAKAFLKALTGSWEGTCRTWFQPGELADESNISGEFQPILGGHFMRHTYRGTIQGKSRSGEETIAFNSVSGKFETSWIDDFHMNYGIMFSNGDPTESGFVVAGKYDVGPGEPPCSWKTEYELIDKDHLTITAYNVLPDGTEAKATDTNYTRKPQ